MLSTHGSSFGAKVECSGGGGQDGMANVEALAMLEEMMKETIALREIIDSLQAEEASSAVTSVSAAGSAALRRVQNRKSMDKASSEVMMLRAQLLEAEAAQMRAEGAAKEAEAALEAERRARELAEAKLAEVLGGKGGGSSRSVTKVASKAGLGSEGGSTPDISEPSDGTSDITSDGWRRVSADQDAQSPNSKGGSSGGGSGGDEKHHKGFDFFGGLFRHKDKHQKDAKHLKDSKHKDGKKEVNEEEEIQYSSA